MSLSISIILVCIQHVFKLTFSSQETPKWQHSSSVQLYFVSPQERPWRQRVVRRIKLVIARNLCVFSRVQKGTPGLAHKGCVLQRVSLGALSDVMVILEMRQSIQTYIYTFDRAIFHISGVENIAWHLPDRRTWCFSSECPDSVCVGWSHRPHCCSLSDWRAGHHCMMGENQSKLIEIMIKNSGIHYQKKDTYM